MKARRHNTAFAAFGLLGVLLAVTNLSSPVHGSEPASAIKDASRIVSIGGAITEILYALGRESQIVAVDTTSLYPMRALQDKPNVGYMRQLSAEGVLGLRPSLILAVEGAGPKSTVSVLEAAGIPFASIPDPHTGAGVIEKIRMVAKLSGDAAQGECLVSTVKADLDALERVRARVERPARVLFLMSLAGDRLLVAGTNTAADGIIRLAGAVNAMPAFEGYKAVNDEAIIGARPDAILVMQRSQQDITAAEVFAHPAFATTPAAVRKAFISLDGLYLLGFGPRTALAARDIAKRLYPQLAFGELPSEANGAPNGNCH